MTGNQCACGNQIQGSYSQCRECAARNKRIQAEQRPVPAMIVDASVDYLSTDVARARVQRLHEQGKTLPEIQELTRGDIYRMDHRDRNHDDIYSMTTLNMWTQTDAYDAVKDAKQRAQMLRSTRKAGDTV